MSTSFDYFAVLIRLLPESILILGGLLLLFLDQSRTAHASLASRVNLSTSIALFSCLGAAIAVLAVSDTGSFYDGMLVLSPFTRLVKVCLLMLMAATMATANPARFTEHIGEYFALILLGGVGLLLLGGTEELLTGFISLELVSLTLYLLAGFAKHSAASAEGAMKYFLFGSVSAAFTLFGISLVFGLAGATNFSRIAAVLSTQPLSPLLISGIVLVTIGFGFKLAAAPLHLWAPDAYQGSPAPSAALIASASKLASLVLFARFFVSALYPHEGSAAFASAVSGWKLAIAVIATLSIILGNLLAIAQPNFRRLLAYSAVAHAGYVLIGILAGTERGLNSGVFYLFTYGLAIVGTFAIIAELERENGKLLITDFAGLSRRSPLLALCLFVFMLSLAGIPPLAGFFGKFYLFVAALDSSGPGPVPDLLWIVAVALAASAVSLYYYLQVLKQAFVVEPSGVTAPILPSRTAAIALLAAAVIFFGCFPQVLLEPLERASVSARPAQATPEFTVISPDVSGQVK